MVMSFETLCRTQELSSITKKVSNFETFAASTSGI